MALSGPKRRMKRGGGGGAVWIGGGGAEDDSLWRADEPVYEYGSDAVGHSELLPPAVWRARVGDSVRCERPAHHGSRGGDAWKCSTAAAVGSMSTRTASRPACCEWIRTGGSTRRNGVLGQSPVSCWLSPTGCESPESGTWPWRRLGFTGSLSGTSWRASSSYFWRTRSTSRPSPDARATRTTVSGSPTCSSMAYCETVSCRPGRPGSYATSPA